MTPKELAAYARIMRKHGVSQLTLADCSITVDLTFTKDERRAPAEQVAPTTQEDLIQGLTEDQILNWSSQASNE